ncbi:MAG TPA: SusD/RagB family nutrient-binding outer membrane lipoprotein, partial [Chitinophagaceae bacterium]
PISAFEVSRPNYLFVDQNMLNLMNPKNDPRRPFYFTDFPLGSGIYVGVSATAPPINANNNNSRIHTFLRGLVTTPSSNGINSAVYSGDAPQRMLPYAEYCFIRAEAALMGATPTPLANAQAWYQAGITASMQEVGVSAADITTYIAANGTLSGSSANMLRQIIEEKYIALFGVTNEPWTDWRRTGYPALSVPANVTNGVSAVPRILFYPQSEIDLNPNCPGQKGASLQTGPFWDN